MTQPARPYTEAAAASGGCIIVDATRSATKRFPDSFSKTVPIWCEVFTRAVVDAKKKAALLPPAASDAAAAEECAGSGETSPLESRAEGLAGHEAEEAVAGPAGNAGGDRAAAASGEEAGRSGGAAPVWGDGPHLPLWVGDNERNSIRARMPDFCAALANVAPDLSR